MPLNEKGADIFIRKNIVTLNDDYFLINNGKNRTFYSIDTVRSFLHTFKEEDKDLLSF